MSKEKGFTLVELLAVIVILGIVLIIAVPGVLGIINNAKKNAWMNGGSVLIETMKLDHQANGVKEKTEYSVKDNRIIRKETTNVPTGMVPFDGKFDGTGEVTIDERGKVTAAFSNDQWCASKMVKDAKLKVNDGACDLSIFDTTPPVVKQFVSTQQTSNSITVSMSCEDSETRIIGYQFSKDGGKSYSKQVVDSIYTLDKLKSGTYQLRGKCINKAGLSSESEIIEKSTVEIEVPTYSVEPSGDTWAPKKNVTITYPERKEGYIYQYSLDSGKTWIELETGVSKTLEFTTPGNVIARISDGTNYKTGSSYSVGKVDSTAPTELSVGIGTKTTNSIQVMANGSDTESGITKYEFSIDGGSYVDNGVNNTYTFTKVTTGAHTVKIRLTNGSGLTTEASTSVAPNEITSPTYSVNVAGWAEKKTVTITYPTRESGFVYQYSLNGGSSWDTVSSGTTKTIDYEEPGTVIARIYDGVNYKTASSYSVALVGLESCFTFLPEEGEIHDYNNDCPKDVVIPSSIKGVTVTTIGWTAFMNNQLTSVVIPDSVTWIDYSAFASNQLTNVVIPDSVTKLGESAFDNNRLTSVVISKNITSIGSRTFRNNRLTSVTIPTGVTGIGLGAFRDNQLKSVTIPNSVVRIDTEAFSNNQLPDDQAFIYNRKGDGSEDKTSLNSYGGAKRDNVVIPNSVTTIGNYAFENNQLTSVTIPNSVTSIKVAAFKNNRLTSVTIPAGVTKIEWMIFSDNQLTSVTIPSGVTSIGYKAFGSNKLTSVTIPPLVMEIEDQAFSSNPDLTSIIIKGKTSLSEFTSLEDPWYTGTPTITFEP